MASDAAEQLAALALSTTQYACTFRCGSTFNNRADWCRHENSQHFQNEHWRCGVENCHNISWTQDQFVEHLKTHHDVDTQTRESYIADRHVGSNHQESFWCGFCEAILELESLGSDAFEERADHIEEHFIKNGCTIEDWVS